MEETIINSPTLFEVLVSSPTTYIVLLVIVLTIIGLKMEKSSPKCCESNKTSSPSKPKRAKRLLPKRLLPKRRLVKRRSLNALQKRVVSKLLKI